MAKMGICTIDGYRGAQIFEALGLEQGLVDRYFTGTSSRVGGAGIGRDRRRDADAPPGGLSPAQHGGDRSGRGGQLQWRSDGEYHNFNPLTIHKLQVACRTGSYSVFQEYSA